MYRSLFFLFVITLLTSCSVLRPTVNKSEVPLSDTQLEELVSRSVSELIKELWLSNFMTETKERPILMTSGISAPNHIRYNSEKGIELFDIALLNSGQVRIVKSTPQQQSINPVELAKGESVDFVISASIIENDTVQPPVLQFTVSLWSDKSSTPISEITNNIETNISE